MATPTAVPASAGAVCEITDLVLAKFSEKVHAAALNGFGAYVNHDEVNALVGAFGAAAKNKQAPSVALALYALVVELTTTKAA